jgi:cyanophycin synthetase
MRLHRVCRAHLDMKALAVDDLCGLRANPRFLIKELLDRGITVNVFDLDREIFFAEFGGVRHTLLGIETESLSWVARELVHDKALAKKVLLEGDLSTPPGKAFAFRNIDAALIYAMQIGFPVVVKPLDKGRGEDVHVGLRSFAEVEGAAEAISERQGGVNVLVEKQFDGEELRVFITRNGRYAAVRRTPASLIGDGVSSIQDLARHETERRMEPRINCLGPIKIDAAAERWLARQGLTRDLVIPRGTRIEVLGHVDGSGAYVVDATAEIHPSVAGICHRAIQLFPSASYLGIDLVSRDPQAPQTSDSYAILEVNTNAALGVHMAPAEGPGRNVAAEIADQLFPGTESRDQKLERCFGL